jgi:hypothetical protein
MDHLVIIYLLLRGTKWDLERSGSRSPYQGPLLPGFPWKTARFLSMVGFLVFAVNKADAVRDHSASSFFFGLLVLYVVWRAIRLYQTHPPYRQVVGICSLAVFVAIAAAAVLMRIPTVAG